MILNNIELMKISGGSITATMINAITKAMTTILKIGQTIGSVLRRSIKGTYCIG